MDAICDGKDVLIPGIMEHIERAGIHSGDSISVYPGRIAEPPSFSNKMIDTTIKLAHELHVVGMINIQYIVYANELYLIEVNPRALRALCRISARSRACRVIQLATNAVLGQSLQRPGLPNRPGAVGRLCIAVKVPVFSFEKLPQLEVSLGPEMKSTGEVLGVSQRLYRAPC